MKQLSIERFLFGSKKLSTAITLLVVTQTFTLQASSITASFTDGTGTTSVDQFQGIAGSGWLTAWATASGGTGFTGTTSATVTSSIPVLNGSNYLSVVVQGTASGIGYGAVTRRHDTSVVSLTSPLTYDFDYRLDGTNGSGSNVKIFSDTASNASTGSSNTWTIQAANTGSTYYWQFINGNKAGGSTSTITSTVAVTVGDIYHFTITVDPTNQSWTVTVTDSTTPSSYTSTTLGFRSSATTEGSYLIFDAYDGTSVTTDTVSFSIDNIVIASIPEPSTIALVTLGVSLFLALQIRNIGSRHFKHRS